MNPLNIFAELQEVKYKPRIPVTLESHAVDDLLAGNLASRGAFILDCNGNAFAVSQWVSPKRTRTFPYARVYDTLRMKNRVTLIPFCKDEGADGDRDFLQWDTVSLMSVLNVHVIPCYYVKAQRTTRPGQTRKNKITKQVLDYRHAHKKLCELRDYHSGALHWNLLQMERLSEVAELTLDSYREIARRTGVRLHGENGIKKRIQIITDDVAEFKRLSRELAEEAQHRERLTDQPKERTVARKAAVTMKNLIGGLYNWTADECIVASGHVFLIEKKHSQSKLLPSRGDIKDAFIKSALFCNIKTLTVNGERMPHQTAVGLTSGVVRGSLHSAMSDAEIDKFLTDNNAGDAERKFVAQIIAEANTNGFGLFIVNAGNADADQEKLLEMFVVKSPKHK